MQTTRTYVTFQTMPGDVLQLAVRARIDASGLSLRRVGQIVAAITDVSPDSGVRSVRRIANGENANPNYDTLDAIAKALGITVADLVTPPPVIDAGVEEGVVSDAETGWKDDGSDEPPRRRSSRAKKR